jgi:hypothetical protein
MMIVLHKVVNVVEIVKICEITLGYICKSNFTHGIYIKCENFTKSKISSKRLLNCR